MVKGSVVGSLLLTAAVSTGLLGARSDSQRAFLDAEALLAGWESTYGSIRTMRVSYVEHLTEHVPRKTPVEGPDGEVGSPVKHNHVERIEAGKRYHLRYSLGVGGFDDPEWLVEYAFNGKNTQSYLGSTKGGMISPGQRGGSEESENALKRAVFLTHHNAPDILKEEYPNGVPELPRFFKLGKLRGEVIVRPNLEYVAGEPCHVVEIIDHSHSGVGGEPGGYKRVCWMAHDKGMCPMKYQMVRNGELTSEIVVEKIAVAHMDGNNVWYPQKSHRTVRSDMSGTTKRELTVTDFVPNVEVDDSTFRFDFPIGTHVADRVLGLSYFVGSAGPNGEVGPVRDISSAEKKQATNETAREAPDVVKSPPEARVDEPEQPTGNDKEQEEDTVPIVPETGRDKILGLKTFSILGVIVLAAIGLIFWHKRSANT